MFDLRSICIAADDTHAHGGSESDPKPARPEMSLWVSSGHMQCNNGRPLRPWMQSWQGGDDSFLALTGGLCPRSHFVQIVQSVGDCEDEHAECERKQDTDNPSELGVIRLSLDVHEPLQNVNSRNGSNRTKTILFEVR